MPASSQVRVIPIEAPAVISVAPQLAPSPLPTSGVALGVTSLLGTIPAASSPPRLDLALPVAARGLVKASGPAAASVSAKPAAPTPAVATSNRFWTPNLGGVLDELATFAGPRVSATSLVQGRAALEPSDGGLTPAARQTPSEPVRVPPAQSGKLRDAWLYSKIYLSSLYWYTGPRLIERWVELRNRLREAGDKPRAVADLRGFFIAHRVLGSTGSYSPLGFRVASNRLVTKDALLIYDRYFAEDRRARRAFGRMIQRAQRFNPNRRSTQFRKALFHALREASVLPPEEVAAFFDRQLGQERSRQLEDYQREVQPKVLGAFERAVNDVIAEMNRNLPPGERVVGALLLGSFANGAAGPGSDLDVQAIAEGGSTRYNDEFIHRLKDYWVPEEAWSGSPVSTFQYTMPLSKRLISRVHREPYLIFSPYPEVKAAMTRTAEEEKAGAPSKIRDFRGWAFQQFYSGLLRVVLAGYELGEVLK